MGYHDEQGRVPGHLRRAFKEITSRPEFQFNVALAKARLGVSRDDVAERILTKEQREQLNSIRRKRF